MSEQETKKQNSVLQKIFRSVSSFCFSFFLKESLVFRPNVRWKKHNKSVLRMLFEFFYTQKQEMKNETWSIWQLSAKRHQEKQRKKRRDRDKTSWKKSASIFLCLHIFLFVFPRVCIAKQVIQRREIVISIVNLSEKCNFSRRSFFFSCFFCSLEFFSP